LSVRKAVTFGLSFGLTLITIVWVASFVRLGGRARAALVGAFTVACALETAPETRRRPKPPEERSSRRTR
jgi:hypothetical protein